MIPLKDTVQSRTFPIVNWVLIALNVMMFMVELSAVASGRAEAMIEQFGVIPARFLHFRDLQEFSTLITSMFLHAGWVHLFSNMLALYIFGDNVEDRMGHARYLAFYLLCGIAAELTHVYFNPSSMTPTIGASGAIAGILGAYLLLFPHSRVITLIPLFFVPFFVEIPAVVYLVVWFFTQLFSGVLEIVQTAVRPQARAAGGVAWWAHAGGFVVGALLVFLFATPRRKLPPRFADEYYPW